MFQLFASSELPAVGHKPYASVREYLAENAFFGFSWYAYCKKHAEFVNGLDAKRVDELFAQLQLGKEKFINIDQYFDRCQSNAELAGLIKENRGVYGQYLKAQSCNVFF